MFFFEMSEPPAIIQVAQSRADRIRDNIIRRCPHVPAIWAELAAIEIDDLTLPGMPMVILPPGGTSFQMASAILAEMLQPEGIAIVIFCTGENDRHMYEVETYVQEDEALLSRYGFEKWQIVMTEQWHSPGDRDVPEGDILSVWLAVDSYR